jgi:hypothetical protein
VSKLQPVKPDERREVRLATYERNWNRDSSRVSRSLVVTLYRFPSSIGGVERYAATVRVTTSRMTGEAMYSVDITHSVHTDDEALARFQANAWIEEHEARITGELAGSEAA